MDTLLNIVNPRPEALSIVNKINDMLDCYIRIKQEHNMNNLHDTFSPVNPIQGGNTIDEYKCAELYQKYAKTYCDKSFDNHTVIMQTLRYMVHENSITRQGGCNHANIRTTLHKFIIKNKNHILSIYVEQPQICIDLFTLTCETCELFYDAPFPEFQERLLLYYSQLRNNYNVKKMV